MNTLTKNIILAPLNLLYKISPKTELKLLFRLKQGYRLNLKNPKTFNEKLQWIKLYDKNPLMPKCVDKYTVREYIREKGCGEILNELIWQGFNPEDIPFDKLPKKFVIKVTHGSTFNIICTDKAKLDKEQAKKQLKKWLKAKFLPCYGEWFYGIEKPRIIIEKFIESKEGLKDYKVFCFNGEPKYIGVYSDRSNGNKPHQELYDTKWNLINEHTGQFGQPSKLTSKPKNLKTLLNYARTLSEDFRHVRVDFFIENDEIYFGELTFTSGAGYDKFSSKRFAEEMGNQLSLKSSKPKVLMVGPARDVKGGMTTVVDNYYACGLDKQVDLKYIESINDKSNISKFLKEIKGLFEFRKNVKAYDIIHIHMASGRSAYRKGKYAKIAKRYNKKVIYHMHGAGFKDFYERSTLKVKQRITEIVNLADTIIVLSEEWKEFFEKIVPEEKIVILYNSIILPKDFNKNLDTKKMLFLGRIGNRKGIFDLIEVINKLREDYPDIELFVGGDGEVEKLKKIISDKKLENNVKYVGWITGEQKKKLLKDCTYYILPSYNEGMPMTVLEAMSYKCVTISTNVGGIPKIITDNQNGAMVIPGDTAGLCKILKSLFSNSDFRNKLSINARKTAQNKFEASRGTKKVLEIYEKEF